jgi:hypothetical protein
MPKPTKDSSKEFEAFLNKDYSYLDNLNAKQWYEELTRLCKLSVDNDLFLFNGDPNISLFCIWNKTREETETQIVHIGAPTIHLIPRKLKTARQYVRPPIVAPGPQLALVINLNAPNATILAEFERWLMSAREHVRPPVVARGRHTLKGSFDKGTAFKTWQNHKIVQLADLLALNAKRKARGEKPYTEAVLGERWLGMTEPKHTSYAKKVLKEALATLPALGAQIAQEMVNATIAQELIAAWIAKDMKSCD